jgi:hypothetical protein
MDRDILLLLLGAGIAFITTLSGIVLTVVLQHVLVLREDRIRRERERIARERVKDQQVQRVSTSAVRLPLPARPPLREGIFAAAAPKPIYRMQPTD